ncbi:MAG TPA: choice-of-anchor D domain-containing protein [Candidatus Dormibacteraeota bacterium]|nr:choice-of-anchor D domain-containing protein [Candidatus Dormibacteraeota bacterium]
MLVATAAALVLSGMPAAVSAAGTLNVPGDFATIQAAIDAAAPGDTVLVAPGIYPERIDFKGKAITVTSSGGAGVTTIDGGAQGRVVNFSNGEGRSSVLRGFTIQNGRLTEGDAGAGIQILSASPTIANNVITGNSACSDGGGIYESFGSPLIQGNLITNNGASDQGCSGGGGGGIFVGGAATAQVIGNTITGNHGFWGGALVLFAAGSPTVADNVMSGNSSTSDGGAIWSVNQSDAVIVQNLIVNNRSGATGGGVSFSPPSGTLGPELVNNTIAGNSATQGSAVWAGGFFATSRLFNNVLVGGAGEGAVYCDHSFSTATPVFDHNDGFATTEGGGFDANCGTVAGASGNISADPRFAGSGDFHLQAGSPAIDTGNNSAPDLPATDLDGNARVAGAAVDMGAYEAAAAPPPPPPATTFSPASVDFGTVQGSPLVTFAPVTLTNTGGSPLPVTSSQVLTQGGDIFSLVTDGCAGTTLAAGASCVIQVGFLPGAAGTWTGSLQVTDGLGTQTVPLKGTVITGHAAPSTGSLDFGSVRVGRTSTAMTVTVTNDGNAALHIGALSLHGVNPGDFAIRRTTCTNATLQVGGTCTVQLTFKPTATGGRSGTLFIASDDPSSPTGVSLTGTGV